MKDAKVIITFTLLILVEQAIGQVSQAAADISKVIEKETKVAGAEGKLHCTVNGVAAAGGNVFWSKLKTKHTRTTTISRDRTITIRSNPKENGQRKYKVYVKDLTDSKQIFTLAVRRMTVADSGKYECMIYLPGMDSELLPRAIGEMVVQVPPRMLKMQINPFVTAVEGSNATLTCNADGVPKPKIKWTRANGKEFSGGQQTLFGTEIILRDVTNVQDGVYRCTADNNVKPPAVMDIKLQVRTKPVARAFRRSYGQARDKNLEVELACLISGDPQPDLQWYRIMKEKENENDTMVEEPINDDFKHDVSKIGVYPGHNRKASDQWFTLRISQLKSRDFGIYKCTGTNIYGTGHAFIKLYRTPTCQGSLCLYESRILGTPGLSASRTLVIFTLIWALLLSVRG